MPQVCPWSRRTPVLTLSVLASAAIFVVPPAPVSAQPNAATVGLNFAGASAGNFAPPDTDGSVGANHVVEFINGFYRVYNKSNGTLVASSSDDSFWNSAGISTTVTGAGLSDTRMIYDPTSQRWFAVEINTSSTGNQILIGRSESSDPTAGWKATSFVADAGFADYPTLSLDATGVYIGTNNFTSDVGGFSGVSLFSLPKSDLLLGTPSVSNRSTFNDPSANLGFTLHGVLNTGPSLGHGSIVAVNNINFSQINRFNVLNPGGPGATLSATTVINVAATSFPNDSRQPDGTRQIDGGDDRISGTPVYYKGKIYLAHSITSGTHNSVRITILDESTNALVSESTITSSIYDYIFPSLAVSNGNIVVGYTRSGGVGSTDGNLGSFARHGIVNADGSLTFDSTDLTLQSGLVNNYHLFGGAGDRWGDYSATTVDPSNPNIFWTFQEYAVGSGTWGTKISQIIIVPEPASGLLLGIPLLGIAFRARKGRRRSL